MHVTDPEITSEKLYLFNQGNYYHSYRIFGAHLVDGGVRFAVWCPDVQGVSLVGSFNNWQPEPMEMQGSTGVYTKFVPNAKVDDLYKYRITTQAGDTFDKADPYAFWAEVRPGQASRVAYMDYEWHDGEWMENRGGAMDPRPMNIYEVHLGSWKQQENPVDPDYPFLSYRQLADELIPYVQDMGYTHIELLPVMEHPLDASWGYQATGLFAPTSRFGAPTDFMYLVDKAHQAGIAVLLDWVPGHFCPDAFGLEHFNGHNLYESVQHPQWGTYKFNFARSEIRGFLISSAIYWLNVYHADGLRVDGVSSMLYLNFGLPDWAEKRFNRYGGEEDLDALGFLRQFNEAVHTHVPGASTSAEESSTWPLVTAPPAAGGLGFNFKWNMGWMNDTLEYFKTDYIFRNYDHHKLTFSMSYFYSENFVLPLSHDEVVHGKLSLLGRMPGDEWRRFACMRLLAMYQYTHPGGQLTFMGTEYAPYIEWREYESLEWFLLDYPVHRQQQLFTKKLNHCYAENPALWENDYNGYGFHWLDADNTQQCIYVYRRTGRDVGQAITVLLNLQPLVYYDYRIGVPGPGTYVQIFNSDDVAFGGSGVGTFQPVEAEEVPWHGEEWSIQVAVPPLAGIMLQALPQEETEEEAKPAAAR